MFELCMFVLKNSNNRRLIECTLKTLHKFLAIKWIPIPIVFSSQLIEALTLKYFAMQQYRVSTLECLVEIAGIKKQEISGTEQSQVVKGKLVNMFLTVLRKTLSECGINMQTDMDCYCQQSQYNLKLVQTLTNFLFNFLRYHHQLLEEHNNGSREGLKAALQLFLNITKVENQTLFQISCDLWEFMVRDLQRGLPRKNLLNQHQLRHSNPMGGSSSGNSYDLSHPRYELYKHSLHDLKTVMMRKLPRPKEVLVVKDENNNVIKQEMKDTLMLTLHKQMSKVLYMLSSIDPADTRTVIGEKLSAFNSRSANQQQSQSNSEENVFFAELNSLCWSIGAVAGSMPPDVEKSFLVVVIKILLSLCEVQQSKNAKAIIASCIMYVVRKYPRFLKKHWKFLQTVVRKLIEFLAEKHPGVQDMSIETLNEICRKCGHKFLKIQENDVQIFLDELIAGMTPNGMTAKLDPEQIENLYATWSVVISHEKRDRMKASQHIEQLLAGTNQRYQQLLTVCQSGNASEFKNGETIRNFIHLLRIYKGVCLHCGGSHNGCFLLQFTNLYKSLITLYTGYAQLMHQYYTANASVPRSAAPDEIKLMSTLKAEILQLFEVFVAKGAMHSDHEQMAQQLVPSLLDAVLTDYQNCSDAYKEYSCLNVCSALIENLNEKMDSFIPKMFGTLFQITLDMIRDSMDNHPDHRHAFFKFLHNVCRFNFNVFEQMNKTQMQLVINCIMWAHEHIDHQITEFGTKTLNCFLKHIRRITTNSNNGALITMFYRNFLFLILEKLVHVMTDTLHKSSFPAMCYTLKSICNDINSGCGQHLGALSAEDANHNNQQYVAQRLSAFIQQKFQHLTSEVTNKFVIGLFQLADDKAMVSPQSSPNKLKFNNNHNGNGNGNHSANNNAVNAAEAHKQRRDPYVKHCEDFLVAIRSVHRSDSPNNNNHNKQEQKQEAVKHQNNNNNNNNNLSNTDFDDL